MTTVLFNILILTNTIFGLFLTENAPVFTRDETPEQQIVYNELISLNSPDVPSYEVFELAYRGYNNLMKKQAFSKNILSIADFSKPSTEKRLWVIDMNTRKILFHDFVAHGRNSGENFAGKFSNSPNSNMSSLGFYITGETYSGKHGLSLYLNGKDPQFNDKARERAIVIHGADYVSQDYIKKYGRLGRSFGCPALSMDSYQSIIGTIEQGSCLFIYYPDEEFVKKSKWLNS
ncbi:MAG TPA: murein L,D-transpeptidase catalytic domain family protein [Bacteroidales bacterium]|nr:murein L,D-transpeptidase catalytic domain family protein [Bacteroidales bacterium]